MEMSQGAVVVMSQRIVILNVLRLRYPARNVAIE